MLSRNRSSPQKNKHMNMNSIFLKLTFFVVLTICMFSRNAAVAQQPADLQEQHRPQFHFSPKAHWMNDPNGMVYYNGVYHLFYQYYPQATVWGPMHWGHATTKDLFHWEERPIALYPDSLGYIFSGSIVVDKNNSSGLGKTGFPEYFVQVAPSSRLYAILWF